MESLPIFTEFTNSSFVFDQISADMSNSRAFRRSACNRIRAAMMRCPSGFSLQQYVKVCIHSKKGMLNIFEINFI